MLAGPARAETFTVNSERDAVDANRGDGICATADGDCTLRAAVMQANSGRPRVPDTIDLPAGDYELTIPGPDSLNERVGDLEIFPFIGGGLEIVGAGAGSTTVDGGGIDRVFHVYAQLLRSRDADRLAGAAAPEFAVEISGMTIAGGDATGSPEGGGGGVLLSSQGPSLTLDRVVVENNRTEDAVGGGIFAAQGPLFVRESTISGNAARDGGGIANVNGAVTMTGSTLDANEATEYGGGAYNGAIGEGATALFDATNATISGNTAGEEGGGLYNITAGPDGTARVEASLQNATINANASPEGANIYSGVAAVPSITTVEDTIVSNPRGGGNCSFRGQTERVGSRGTNIDEDSSCGLTVGEINADPRLGPLADNGGPTRTHALLAGSPAIDAADGGGTCPPPAI